MLSIPAGGFDAILPACNDRSFYYRSLGLTRNESAEFCQANRGMLARSSAANDNCILQLLRSLGRTQLPIWTRRGCDVNTGAAISTDDCLIRPNGGTGTTRYPEFGQSEPRPFVCESESSRSIVMCALPLQEPASPPPPSQPSANLFFSLYENMT